MSSRLNFIHRTKKSSRAHNVRTLDTPVGRFSIYYLSNIKQHGDSEIGQKKKKIIVQKHRINMFKNRLHKHENAVRKTTVD